MTDDERRLLLLVSNILAEQLEEAAGDRGTTDNAADEMRRLMAAVRQR